ncbi:MAG: hypothetical protein LJE59_07070 [Chromatiaceae bacterium]|jgi:hypothetical protein|nr:hypothetical protein [Chromatiaceae bacterium]
MQDMEKVDRQRRREKIADYVDANSKSPVAGAVYALLYGPLGCIYANPEIAVLAVVVTVFLGLIYWPLIGLAWVACVVMAPFQVRAYNARVRRSARYFVM